MFLEQNQKGSRKKGETVISIFWGDIYRHIYISLILNTKGEIEGSDSSAVLFIWFLHHNEKILGMDRGYSLKRGGDC